MRAQKAQIDVLPGVIEHAACAIIQETIFNSKLAGNEVHCTNALLSLIMNMLWSKLHHHNFAKLKLVFYKISPLFQVVKSKRGVQTVCVEGRGAACGRIVSLLHGSNRCGSFVSSSLLLSLSLS